MFRKIFLGYCVLSVVSVAAQNHFPYAFNKTSAMITAVGAITQSAALALPDPKLSEADILTLDPGNVSWFDRAATRNYSERAHTQSDYTLNLLMVAPAAISAAEVYQAGLENSLIYGGMYVETFLLTNGVKDLTKDLFKRTRPVFYNVDLSIAERTAIANQGDARTSFYSGHTAVAFSSAVFLASTHDEIFDAPIRSTVIWTGALGLATTTGYLRFKAGKHFPSDILAGAIIGSAMGYWVPKMHLKSSSNLTFFPSGNGLGFVYRFEKTPLKEIR